MAFYKLAQNLLCNLYRNPSSKIQHTELSKSMLHKFRLCALAVLPLITAPTWADSNSAFYFGLDNDGVFGVDQDYTNGIFFSYSSDIDVDDNSLFYKLPTQPFSPEHAKETKWSFQLGQKMWTPSDIETPDPQPGERPYAGLLFGEAKLYAIDEDQVSQFGLMIGTTGPNSFAEEGQKLVHSITKSDDPNGWDNQIYNQVVVNLAHKNDRRWYHNQSDAGWGSEWSSNYRVMAGNFRSEVAVGGLYRWGYQLSDNFGSVDITNEATLNPTMIRRAKTGFYMFTGIEGRYRFNDITIEGDRPSSVPDTNVENLQATAVAGLVGYYKGWGMSFSVAGKSKDFEEDKSDFLANGSLALFWLF